MIKEPTQIIYKVPAISAEHHVAAVKVAVERATRELEAENKRLRDAFHEYGCHTENCGKMFWEDPNLDCTCGFDAARLAIDSAK